MADCGSNGWSIITSAQANSNVAGILAGFLFFGLVYLLGRSEKREEVVLLFTASFIVLAFASFLFSRLSGFSVQSTLDPRATADACKAAWMAGMIAIAMLVVGAATMVVGLGYVLVAYNAESERRYLQRLATATAVGVLAGTIFMLYTSTNFYEVLLDSPDKLLTWTFIVVAILMALLIAVITYTSSRGSSRRERRDKYIEWSVYVIGGFGISGAALTGITARIDPSYAVSWLVIAVSAGFPGVIVIMLAGGIVDGRDEKARAKEKASPGSMGGLQRP
ncbi:hypothetical protein [Mycobacterium paraterrae]|uniref:Uncharacterized protein n=1 Tax=Mycobacterium paraterrae TaxID=577492 RepID=A0ABY3VN07_9MYCO|nr:hypothetical protein [Mycobacterium paraterrae]UMB68898.1 hypothetical protein MKK62_21285 [Mycobacterium paraterrae]